MPYQAPQSANSLDAYVQARQPALIHQTLPAHLDYGHNSTDLTIDGKVIELTGGAQPLPQWGKDPCELADLYLRWHLYGPARDANAACTARLASNSRFWAR